MAVGVAVLHLHELRDDGAVGEELDLAGKEHELAAGALRRDGDLLGGGCSALSRPTRSGMPRPSTTKVLYKGVSGAPRICS